MITHAVDHRMPTISRRTFLQAVGLGFAYRPRPIATGLTSIADEIAMLLRWWCDFRGPHLVPC